MLGDQPGEKGGLFVWGGSMNVCIFAKAKVTAEKHCLKMQ